MITSPLNHVFLSYCREDTEVMLKIRKDLNDEALTTWTDEGIKVGTTWQEEIEKGIKNSGVFVVILSPDALKSIWVIREIVYAEACKKQIFPLVVRSLEGATLPIALIGTQYIDLYSDYKNISRQLIPAIANHLGIETFSKIQESLTKNEAQLEQELFRLSLNTENDHVEISRLQQTISDLNQRRLQNLEQTLAYTKQLLEQYQQREQVQLTRLFPWSPKSWGRLLWWLLVNPLQYQAYDRKHKENSRIPSTASALASSLVWLFLWIIVSGVALGTTPFKVPDISNLAVAGCWLFITLGWLITIGIHANLRRFPFLKNIMVSILIAVWVCFAAIMLAVGVTVGLKGILLVGGTGIVVVGVAGGLIFAIRVRSIGMMIPIFVALIFWVVVVATFDVATFGMLGIMAGLMMILVAFVLGLVVSRVVSIGSQTGQSTTEGYLFLVLLISAYAILIYFFLLGGYLPI